MSNIEENMIQVECNIRNGKAFIEGFDFPIDIPINKNIHANCKAVISPEGFICFDDVDTIIKVLISIVCPDNYPYLYNIYRYYNCGTRKFVSNIDEDKIHYFDSDLDGARAYFEESPYKCGKKLYRTKACYTKNFFNLDNCDKNNLKEIFKTIENLFNGLESLKFRESSIRRMDAEYRRNIFICAYMNARTRLNNGYGHGEKKPNFYDFVIELYKLETRLINHGIECPIFPRLGSSIIQIFIDDIEGCFKEATSMIQKFMINLNKNK